MESLEELMNEKFENIWTGKGRENCNTCGAPLSVDGMMKFAKAAEKKKVGKFCFDCMLPVLKSNVLTTWLRDDDVMPNGELTNDYF